MKQLLNISDRNTKLMITMQMMQSAIFIIPVIMPYYQAEIGLTFRDFMIAEAMFAATIILMEVPSGWLSDLWSRKHTLAMGLLFNTIGYAWLLWSDSFWDAATAQCIIGIGISLISGTNSAMLYDSLLQDGKADDYRRLEGKRHGYGLYALGLASVMGGLLYQVNHDLPMILSVITQFLAMICALLMIEPTRDYRAAEKHPVADMFDTMKFALHGHKEIAGIIFFATVIFTASKVMLWTQQPYYALLKLPEIWYGVFTAIGFLIGGFSGHLGHKLDGHIRNRTMFLFMLAAAASACLIAGTITSHAVIPLLLIGSIMYGFGWPRVQSAINMRVSSERRATILSTASLMINLAFIPVGALMGVITDKWGIQDGLLALGTFILIGGSFSLWLFVINAGRKEALVQ